MMQKYDNRFVMLNYNDGNKHDCNYVNYIILIPLTS